MDIEPTQNLDKRIDSLLTEYNKDVIQYPLVQIIRKEGICLWKEKIFGQNMIKKN